MILEQQPTIRVKEPAPRKKHRVYAVVVILLGITIFVLSMLLLFYVQSISVSGNTYTEKAEIAETVQSDPYSVNSIYVWWKYKTGNGKMLPSLESVNIDILLPWSLQVNVKEKNIVGYLFLGEQRYAYFDKEGCVVAISPIYYEEIPCVEGLELKKEVKLYEQLEGKTPELLKEVIGTCDKLREREMPIGRVVCKNDQIYVYLGQICVCLGNTVSAEKLAQIPHVVSELEGLKGTLHLENYTSEKKTLTFDIDELPEE